jgi:hypothetical protein
MHARHRAIEQLGPHADDDVALLHARVFARAARLHALHQKAKPRVGERPGRSIKRGVRHGAWTLTCSRNRG